MKELIKTINGTSCEIFAISHHNRILIGKAEPKIEIYEESVDVPTIGTSNIRCKRTYLSVCICPDPIMEKGITDEVLNGLTAFDLSMLLPRKDDVFIPFTLNGITSADISPEEWVFEITDVETVKRLLAL